VEFEVEFSVGIHSSKETFGGWRKGIDFFKKEWYNKV
jgi:hypothetical protein